MKKKILGFAAALLLTVGLAACGNNSDSKDSANKADDTTLKVGASPTPHAEILEHVKPLLKDEGIDLEIVNSMTTFYRTNLWKKAISMPITSSIFLI